MVEAALIGEPAATDDDDTVSCLPGDEAGSDRGDDVDIEDSGDTHAVVVDTDELFDVVLTGARRHRSSLPPLVGNRCDDDAVLCMQLPMMMTYRF